MKEAKTAVRIVHIDSGKFWRGSQKQIWLLSTNCGINAGGIPKHLRGGETGFLMPLDDDLVLVKAIQTLWQHQSLWQWLGEQPRTYVRNHTIAAIAEQVLKAYGKGMRRTIVQVV
ncbi:MAG: hypothetical protein QXD09_08010 [Candidatus Caldarchaeum sp.]